MIRHGQLNSRQKQLLKKTLDYQIHSLDCIYNGDTHQDLILFCIQQEIKLEDLKEEVYKAKEEYLMLRDNPERVFSLPSEDINILRIILFGIKSGKDKKVKSQLCIKFDVAEKIKQNYSLN